MLEDFLSEPDLTGILAYQNLCLTGNLYPEIARKVFGFEYKNENKRRVKDLFFTLFFLAIDTYVWQGIKTITPHWSNKAQSVLKWSYWGYGSAVFIFFVLIRFQFVMLSPSATKLISAVVFAIVIAKIFWVFFLL
jgi:hypothetical protein